MYIIIITIGTCPFHQLEREVTDLPRLLLGRVFR